MDYTQMDEKALKAELKKRGYKAADIKDLSVEELTAQLVEDDKEAAADNADGSSDAKPAKAKKGEVMAILKGEVLVRCYSVADHGDDMDENIESFLSKNAAYKAVDAGTIGRIEVRYRAWNAEKVLFEDKAVAFTDPQEALLLAAQQPKAVCVVTVAKK